MIMAVQSGQCSDKQRSELTQRKPELMANDRTRLWVS